MKFHILMPCYLHIPHTLDTARALTLSGRNCLVVSGMTTPPPLKSATGAEKGAEAKCVHKARRSPTAGLLRALSRPTAGLLRALSRICASPPTTWTWIGSTSSSLSTVYKHDFIY